MRPLRVYVLQNLSWKLLSLGLAMLIWFGARLFMHQDISPVVRPLQPYGTRDFHSIPVRILSRGNAPRPVSIHPPSLHLRVSGELTVLDRTTEQDPLVFVELPDPLPDGPTTNRVEVRLPPTLRLISATPERVVVQPGKSH